MTKRLGYSIKSIEDMTTPNKLTGVHPFSSNSQNYLAIRGIFTNCADIFIFKVSTTVSLH